MSSTYGLNPPSGDMMKFYRTSYLEAYQKKDSAQYVDPSSLKRPTNTGYSNNQRSKTFVIDVSDIDTHVKLSTAHAAHGRHPHQQVPHHSRVTSSSTQQNNKVSTPAARRYTDCVSNNTVSYDGKNWSHIVPTVDSLNPLPSGYSLNSASIGGIGNNMKPEFGTTYNTFEHGHRKADISAKYASTLSSETAFSKALVEPPCLGVGTDNMRVFISNRDKPYKHHKYASGQPRMTYRRGMDATTLRECARHDDQGSGSFIREKNPTVELKHVGDTLYTSEFKDPEFVRAEIAPRSLSQTGELASGDGFKTGRFSLPGSLTSPLPSSMSATMNNTSRSQHSNVLMRTGNTMYNQQFVRHQV